MAVLFAKHVQGLACMILMLYGTYRKLFSGYFERQYKLASQVTLFHKHAHTLPDIHKGIS